MTKKGAINRIEAILYYMESLDADKEEEKDIQALQMGVAALQREIKNDRKRRADSGVLGVIKWEKPKN